MYKIKSNDYIYISANSMGLASKGSFFKWARKIQGGFPLNNSQFSCKMHFKIYTELSVKTFKDQKGMVSTE